MKVHGLVLVTILGMSAGCGQSSTTTPATSAGTRHTTMKPAVDDTTSPAAGNAGAPVDVRIGPSANPSKPLVDVEPQGGVQVNVPPGAADRIRERRAERAAETEGVPPATP